MELAEDFEVIFVSNRQAAELATISAQLAEQETVIEK